MCDLSLPMLDHRFTNSPEHLYYFTKRNGFESLTSHIQFLTHYFIFIPMSDELLPCPDCSSPYGYPSGNGLFACPECGHEWNPEEAITSEEEVIKDANGNVLQDGDSVVVVKDLPVKGASGPVKKGTKVKNIRLTDGDHNIDCKIDGFGAMALKSGFVKKA